MLSLEQVKHVVTYYYLDMMKEYEKNTPVHIQRDCVFLNKSRGEICADLHSNPKLKHIISKIHYATDVHQINSVPVNSVCCVDDKKIPLASGGIQFIVYGQDKTKEHLCIQKKYQHLCYYYFKLRNFPSYTQREILKWLNKQPWYLPKSMPVNTILKRLLDSNFPERVHRDLSEIIDILNRY
jgi:hypothetical protein